MKAFAMTPEQFAKFMSNPSPETLDEIQRENTQPNPNVGPDGKLKFKRVPHSESKADPKLTMEAVASHTSEEDISELAKLTHGLIEGVSQLDPSDPDGILVFTAERLATCFRAGYASAVQDALDGLLDLSACAKAPAPDVTPPQSPKSKKGGHK